MIHEVRALDSGETFFVTDSRPPGISVYAPTPYVPAAPPLRRTPTNAELAGSPSGSLTSRSNSIERMGFTRSSKVSPPPAAPTQPPAAAQPATTQPPASLQAQLANLKDGAVPSQRELAAMSLTLSEHHKSPEVVTALMTSCKTDPAATVRATCVRCLFRLSVESPQVIPIIADRQSDKNVEVQKIAKLAMEELERRHSISDKR
jgi:hypothetical protein